FVIYEKNYVDYKYFIFKNNVGTQNFYSENLKSKSLPIKNSQIKNNSFSISYEVLLMGQYFKKLTKKDRLKILKIIDNFYYKNNKKPKFLFKNKNTLGSSYSSSTNEFLI